MDEQQRQAQRRRQQIKNLYQSIGIEEGGIRSAAMTQEDSYDEAERRMSSYAFKALATMIEGADLRQYHCWLLDKFHDINTVRSLVLKSQVRRNGGDMALDTLLTGAIETYTEDQELYEWLSEIAEDYFKTYASSGEKDFIASDLDSLITTAFEYVESH